MAEKSAWRTQGSSPAPRHPQGQETIRELSKAWETISKTKAALRHIENKLDVAPTSTAVFDIVMDTKKPLTSATRKISRKDGRYLEDSTSYISKSSHPNKSRREKSSRSPLRVTTLESNVKSTSHVGFTEPLASYWEAVSTQPTTSERGAMRPVSSLDVGGQEEREFDSTRSSAVDETSVRYLNDRPAIDALDDRLQGPYRDICGSALLTDHKGVRPHETSQPPPSFSPSSLRLETLKRRQPDSKLEKLKERIRRQWELSGERDVREHFPSSVNYTETITIAKTRKVTSAPPAPVYRGFNPPETKIRTPDGKLWQEEDFHNLSAQLYGALLPPPEVGISSNDKSRLKRTSRTVRKVQRLGGAGGPGSPESKTGKGHIISTSSWRDGQKLVKQILGPAPKLEKESKALSSDRPADKRTLSSDRQMGKRAVSSDRNADKRPVPSERQREKRPISSDKQTDRRGLSTERPMDHQDRVNKSASSSERSESGHHVDKSHRGPTHSTNSVNGNNTKPHVPLDDHMESAEVKKDFLPLEIRGILDDLQLDSGIDVPKQTRSRSHSPTKRKPEKGHVAEEPQISSKRRHYDTEQVRLYILRQQEERKKRQSEERKAQRQAEEQKTKRLRELYQKQKEAFGKARSVSPCQRLQDREAQEPIFNQSLEPNLHQPQETHPRALPGQAWPDPTAQEKQFKPMYQPSGESDKENKGQERPPSASSSSDLSLSEPLQPLLSVDTSASSVKEELPIMNSGSEVMSPHSSGACSAASSPASSSSQRGNKQRKLMQNSAQLPLEHDQNSSGSEHKGQGSKPAQAMSPGRERSAGSDTDSTMGDLSSRSMASLLSDSGRALRSHHSSAKDTGGRVPTPPGQFTTAVPGPQPSGLGQGSIRFSPAGLQQRMSAELNYLSAMEESMRQLYDVERARGISLAQQETVSLAQILKVHTTFLPEGPGWMLAHHLITSFSWPLQAQQQRHEQNMATLRLQAEQEAQASLRQLEEARQKSAQTQAEMLQRFQKTPETPTPQRAHRIQEDVDRGYLSPASSDPIVTSVIDQQKRQQWPHGSRKKGPHSVSPSSQPTSSSSSFREHPHSSSGHDSPPAPSVMDVTLNHSELEESIAEELVSPGRFSLTEDSTPTLEEKGTSSALPVDEEGIEELSFRSLLPSEAHRRGSLERQRSQRHESDEESTPDKELSGPFSSGQDSFWRFTMEMVQQYMQEGEMRSTHQAALLRLRQRALKDKTKAELAWLEHQKRRLRDKGEDDKMPPLRKRQRGLLLRLQQEQAEIKRLQEANKAARRERQLILKQQEEIQRIQNSTLRLQEKLKSAESGQLELPSEGEIQPSSVSSHVPSDAESRSPSPVSVSGSETSSIMQKLRKMHSHMDAKFLTKREQQLVQRRLHAQELLEWKRRLDAEELEIRCIEKQALAAWESQRVKTKSQSTEAEEKVVGEKERSEGSPVPLSPAIHTKSSRSPIPQHVLSESIEPSTIDEHIEEQSGEHSSISEDLVASSPSKESPPRSGKSTGQAESSTGSAKTGRHIPRRPQQLSHSWCEESLSMTHSETVSDQSDIESRIRALKEELKKRKSVVDNLKREQKRRQKERLRAQEAVLLQQLQSYDEFIQKTQAELSGEQGTTPSPKSSPKAAMTIREASIAIPASPHRSDGTPIWKSVNENERLVECSSESYGSFSPERSLSSRREVEAEHILEQSVHASSVPLASREDVPAAHQSSLLSPPFGNQLPSSTHDSPVSSIASEIHEEVLETHSHLSISPPPALCLDLRSPTPEGSPSPHKDQSYSDDFEASAPMKHSVSETPREELEASYTTSPGRDVPSEGPSKDDEEHSECWSGSPHSQGILELNPPLQEPPLYSETTDPLAGFLLGDRVLVSGVQPGTLHFKGETQFAEGVWAGIELDRPEGNNDGAHGGRRYFTCPHQHGIFAPPHKISHLSEEKQSPPHTNRYDSSDGRSAEHKEEIDRCLSPTSVEAHEPKTMEMTPLQSTVSNVPELCSTALEDKFNTHDTQLDIPTETTTPEESKKPHTPLLDRLVKEEHRLPTFNKQAQEVSTVTESVLEVCLTDTISHLRNIRRQREERIRQSNQELRRSSIALLYSKKEEVLNTDTHPQPLPVFDVHGQQDLPKHSAELGPSHSLLTVLGEESDWFGEDFGLRSRRTQQRKLEHFPSAEPTPEPCLLVPHPEPAPEPFQALPQPEPIMTVPHTAPEVEQLVHLAAEELWRWKQQSGDLEEIRTRYTQIGDDEQDLANCAYKEVLFDLTLHIFEEMCSPDPRESQPLWKKPPRVTPSYTRRVKDPRNFQEVKSFLTDEVLSLLNLKKEPNHKTDWQRMIKFGRKKRDRVDHILVQELHEEEAQWVNYDEDELFVKMQLADGIFEALVRDTVHVLQCIQEKKNRPLLV
ncbi:hypothetical protein FKM82_002153 [Ascaphus truei]